jgi:hypothetical protein
MLRADASGLLKVLPAIVHIRNDSDEAVLRDAQPGGFLLAQQLATMVPVQALRLRLAGGPKGGIGWLFAPADGPMAAAITAIHNDPARRWTLHTLVACAGISRTILALKSKRRLGSHRWVI